jgi:hypothetical protein
MIKLVFEIMLQSYNGFFEKFIQGTAQTPAIGRQTPTMPMEVEK